MAHSHRGSTPADLLWSLNSGTFAFIGRCILRLPLGIFWLVRHVCWALANGKSLPGWVWAVAVGAFPPILWTFCFKQAGKIPDSWRPPIHTDLLPRGDELLLSPSGLLIFTFLLSPISYLLWTHSAPGPIPNPFSGPSKSSLSLAASSAQASGSRSNSSIDDESPQDKTFLTPPLLTRSRSGSLTSQASSAEDGSAEEAWGKLYALWLLAFPAVLGLMHYWAFGEQRAWKDLAAWITYGGWCLGFQNIAGVITHLSFPNSAPWFVDVYGSLHPDPPPDYTFPGNPAGLVRVDELLGTHLYASGFKHSPVVFGAMPSLHAASAVICFYFVTRYSRRKGLLFMTWYTYHMFWSTMYFHHHYAVDLIGGTLYSTIAFFIAVRYVLPESTPGTQQNRQQSDGTARSLVEASSAHLSGSTGGSGHWIGELPLHERSGSREEYTLMTQVGGLIKEN